MPASLQILPTKNTFKYDQLLHRTTELCKKNSAAVKKKKKVLGNFKDRYVRIVKTYW